MNSVIAGIVRSGGAALVVLHELAPAKAILDRTLTLFEGRIEPAHPERGVRDHATPTDTR
jgi:ABC-type hemin transport system ATPase subunit